MPPATSLPVRPFVVDFLREAGRTVSTTAPWHVEGGPVDVVVEEHEGTLTVRQVAGVDGPGTRLVTVDPRVVETYLVMQAAAGWRRTHARRRLADRALRRPRTHGVVRWDDGTSAVRRADGAVAAWHLSPADARRLASALDHPVETVIAAAQEKDGRPVWTGSTLAPVVASVVVGLVLLGTVHRAQVSRHAGSPEFVVGTSLGLTICVVGGLWLVVGTTHGRRRTAAALDRDRPGAPRWRCATGPGFTTAAPGPGVRARLPRRRQVEVTLVETSTGLEVWRGVAPLLHLPWHQVASVDCEPTSASTVGMLVVRTRDGGRVPVIPLSHRTGGQRGASVQVTEEYAAHLRDRYLARP